jgi:hypothetical protein
MVTAQAIWLGFCCRMLTLFTAGHRYYRATFAGYMERSRVRIAPPITFIGKFEARARAFGLFDPPTGYVVANANGP